MEGNECYKLSTIRNFIERTGQKPIETIVEIGVNIGDVSLLMNSFFPKARIYGFEPVNEYYQIACKKTVSKANIRLFPNAVTSQHRFADDLAKQRLEVEAPLHIWKGQPAAGPGWMGGSQVWPVGHFGADANLGPGLTELAEQVHPLTLDDVLNELLINSIGSDLDILKLDCEGCEHSVLGCISPSTLKRLRFVVGEYHGLARFYKIMEGNLFSTHKVSLIGDSELGCFFAERRDGNKDGILKYDNAGMLELRPWLCPFPIQWHVFNEKYVISEEKRCHALE